MRIGLFTDTYLPDINGVVSSTVTLKKALEKAGHTVFVITNHAGTKIDYHDRILRLPGIPLKMLYGYKLSSPLSVNAGSYIKNMNLDVIHLQTNFGIGIYGQTMAKSWGIPLVDTYHTMYEDYTHYINPIGLGGIDKISKEAIRAATRQVCNHVQAVVAPSEKTKETLQEYGVEAPIYVVPTGLDLEAFEYRDSWKEDYDSIRARISTDPDDIVICYVGRLAKEKSIEMPIEAFAKIQDPRFHLAIIGAGTDEQYYKDMVKELGAEDKIHFLGKADPSEVGKFYGAFDAFVSASLSETQGMTYLEALASGKMIFARRDDVVSDLLEEKESGYYFDSADELIEKLMEFSKLSKEERDARRPVCVKKTAPYTSVTFASTMAAVYDQAIMDYSNTYNVDKLKMEDDFVLLTLSKDSLREPIKLRLPIDQYFELKLAVDTKLDEYLVNHYLNLQKEFEAWGHLKKRVLSKDMTTSQVLHHAKHVLGIDDKHAKEMVEELERRHLIDDETFASDKAQYWQDMGYSSRHIFQKLSKAGIELEMAHEAVDSLNMDAEQDNASALANRLVKSVKHKSAQMKRQYVINRLVSKGYTFDMARRASEDLPIDESDDSVELEHTFAKACRMYARLDKDERKQKVKQYCMKAGFSYEDINRLLESVEWDD